MKTVPYHQRKEGVDDEERGDNQVRHMRPCELELGGHDAVLRVRDVCLEQLNCTDVVNVGTITVTEIVVGLRWGKGKREKTMMLEN